MLNIFYFGYRLLGHTVGAVLIVKILSRINAFHDLHTDQFILTKIKALKCGFADFPLDAISIFSTIALKVLM